MSNLTKFSAIFKKTTSILGFILIIIILLALIFLRGKNIKQTQTKLPKLPATSLQTLPTQIVSIDTSRMASPKNLPDTLTVYSIDNQADVSKNTDQLVQKFNLAGQTPLTVQDKTKGTGKVYADQTGSLSIFPNLVSYQKVGQEPTPQPFNVDVLKQKALEDLASTGSKNLDTEPDIGYSKIQKGSIIKTTLPQDASLITFTFKEAVSSYPVVNQLGSTSIAYDAQGNIFRLLYTPQPEFKSQNVYPIMKIGQSIEVLKKTPKPIISIQPLGEGGPALSVDRIAITSAYLAYILDYENKLLEPVWVFVGTSQIASQQLDITAVVPAISSDFFK